MKHILKATAAAVAVLILGTSTGSARTIVASAGQTDPVHQLLGQQETGTPPVTPLNDGEAYHRADDDAQDPAEVRTTQALNAEMAVLNRQAEDQALADQESYELERARYQATVDHAIKERLGYEAAAREAEAARRQWEADRDRTEQGRDHYAAGLLACRTGDRSRCRQ